MTVVNIHEAKSQLSRLIEQALQGQEIIIGRAGKPIARLVPYEPLKKPPREPGFWRGKVCIHEDFDELPADIAAAFRGEHE